MHVHPFLLDVAGQHIDLAARAIAVARAQLATGAAITTYTSGSSRFEIPGGNIGPSLLDVFESEGVDPRRVVVGHTDVAAGEAMQLHSLTDRIRLLTNSHSHEISPKFQQRLENAKIPVIDDHIRSVEGDSGMMTAVRVST